MPLKQATVVSAFKKRGWKWFQNGNNFCLMYGNIPGRIFGRFNNGQLKLFDARLKGHSNVHIISYWGPFRSMKELHADLESIERLYYELCGTYFQPAEIPRLLLKCTKCGAKYERTLPWVPNEHYPCKKCEKYTRWEKV